MLNTTNRQKRAINKMAKQEQIKQFVLINGLNNEDGEVVRRLLRQRCVDDFWFFQFYCCGNADTNNPLHIELAHRVQKRIDKLRTLWLLPRSHLKTSEITVGGILWCLIRDPHIRNLVVNAKLENAVAILADIRSIVETNEIFRWLFSEYCPDLAPAHLRNRCKWLTHRLDFPCSKYAGRKEGNIEVMGVEGSLVSRHYDRLWFDDPVNDDNTTTKDYRDKIYRWYRNSLQLRHDLNSPVWIIGTRWHFDDLYARLIKTEKDRRFSLKEKGDKVTPYLWIYHRQVVEKAEDGEGQTIAGYDNVLPIWPERYTAEAINQLKEDNGTYIFSCQFMNNPLPEEDAVFKYSDILTASEYDIPEDVINFIACDIAVEDNTSGDWWVITVASIDSDGNMYVREVIRDHLLTSSFLEHVMDLTEKWKPIRVGIEAVAFQTTLNKEYRRRTNNARVNVPWTELTRTKKSKRARILGLQPRVERHAFFIEENIKNADWIIEEMTTYPRSAYDDILDTLADIETLYFSSPKEEVVVKRNDTYDAIYGSLEDEEYSDESYASSIITSY